jgi:hypothetical protein
MSHSKSNKITKMLEKFIETYIENWQAYHWCGGWYLVTNGKWQIQVAVKLIGPVVARVNCPFVTNCGEGGLRIH